MHSKRGIAEGKPFIQMSGCSGGNFWPPCNKLMRCSWGQSTFNHTMLHVCGSPHFQWNNLHAEPGNVLHLFPFLSFCFPVHSFNLPSKNLRIIESLVVLEKPSPEIGLDVLAWSISTSRMKRRLKGYKLFIQTGKEILQMDIQGLTNQEILNQKIQEFINPSIYHACMHASMHPFI